MGLVLKKKQNIFRTVWGKLYGASESPQNSESNQGKKHGTEKGITYILRHMGQTRPRFIYSIEYSRNPKF